MADFAHHQSALSPPSPSTTPTPVYLETISEYDLYCHYVAGLVGEGLSGLFSASGKESPLLRTQLELSNSMGLLLQKTNIIRDFREDCDEGRCFWPREIWGRFGFAEMRDMHNWEEPGTRERALDVQSAMILDALRHATDGLDYLRLLRNQSVFNFVAIPAGMALATLALCFGNEDLFKKNVKIRKGEAVRLIQSLTNPRVAAASFRASARLIHAKLRPTDPSFLAISVACGKIELWCERQYPSFVRLLPPSVSAPARQEYDAGDARAKVVELEQEQGKGGAGAGAGAGLPWVLMFGSVAVFLLLVSAVGGIVWVILKAVGDMEGEL